MHIDLAEISYALIHEQDNLYSRINIVGLLVADVSAMIRDAHKRGTTEKATADDLAVISDCWKTIEEIRQKYDPMLDNDDFTYGERSILDIVLDDVILKLKKLVYDYDLLKSGAMMSYQAPTWGSAESDTE